MVSKKTGTNSFYRKKPLIRKPQHNRRLVLGGAAYTMHRHNKNVNSSLNVIRDEIETVLINSDFFEGAKFSWVSLIVRFGSATKTMPTYQAINKKYGDLPLAIEVNADELSDGNEKDIYLILKRAVLFALVHAARRFGRPSEMLEKGLHAVTEVTSKRS